jgi:hypothetical protein
LSRKVKSPCVVYVMDSLHLTTSNINIGRWRCGGLKKHFLPTP